MFPENNHPDGRERSFLSECAAKFFLRSKLKIGLYVIGGNTILNLSGKFQPNQIKNVA
jgi:hypothetical protein